MAELNDRRFSEDETTSIISRAARAQHAIAPIRETGLSLAELQDIGAAAGLDRMHVAAAAATLQAEAVVAEEWMGRPTEIRETRVISIPVGDRAWERMVPVLRKHFKSVGHAGQIGRVREWGPSSDGGRGFAPPIRISVAPHDLGAVVTVHQADVHNQRKLILTAGGTFAVMGVVLATLAIAAGAPVALGVLGAANLLGGAAISAWGWKSGDRVERARRAEFDPLLDRLELIARSEEERV